MKILKRISVDLSLPRHIILAIAFDRSLNDWDRWNHFHRLDQVFCLTWLKGSVSDICDFSIRIEGSGKIKICYWAGPFVSPRIEGASWIVEDFGWPVVIGDRTKGTWRDLYKNRAGEHFVLGVTILGGVTPHINRGHF